VKKFDPALILAIPLLGVIGGGYFSLPVLQLTRGREPYTSLILGVGIAAIVWSIAHHILSVSIGYSALMSVLPLAVYLISTSVGGFRQHIEPFFMAHMMAIMVIFLGSTLLKKSGATGSHILNPNQAEQADAGNRRSAGA
jgi:hypothetical protein